MRVVVAPGLDPYHYYYLMGPALDLKPGVVVLIAHLRLFDLSSERRVEDFPELIPTSELGKAMVLPFARRGITIPELLLRRCLRFRWAEGAVRNLEGLRVTVRDRLLPDLSRQAQESVRERESAVRERALHRYDTRIGPRHAMLKMLAASIELASRRGAMVLVVIAPVPYELLEEHGWYGEERFSRRVSYVQKAVQEEGATVLDLHRALRRSGFRDELGHYSVEGSERLADLVEPTLEMLISRLGGPGAQGSSKSPQ